MSLRAILLGLTGAAFVCGYTYVNDVVLKQTKFIGNHLPLSVFGGLVLFLLLVQPALRKLRERWALTPTELMVVLALTLSACVIPSSGLMRYFTPALMMPHHFERTEPGWRESGLVQSVPDRMLADISEDGDRALNGFVQGLSDGERRITVSDVPWHAWTRTLLFWVPLVLASWLCILGLALVVHRQWAHHEMLPYPVAKFANQLVSAPEPGQTPLLRQRPFLLGCLLKWVVTRYGGTNVYERLKPVMNVIIAGDMLGGLLPSLVGAGYYLVTGELAPAFQIMPR
ncbi:MAG: hypothetical protein HN742_25735 [Lentisphaerae bacterium]|jgi:hypothetical protein|nr:hypothetical protein [Lentisphaerota bacterium]MBT4814414.1 hypothetical protein [Lentisphaerota bacterium]MBT5608020.1 hypothetical protein [Lentisphaerota bacterium]MBT7056024.1 hypothetical protein [Lentisphaerota bacterium]MBT7845302.1 hypothetical protein [Lentisphaerota bacterium]